MTDSGQFQTSSSATTTAAVTILPPIAARPKMMAAASSRSVPLPRIVVDIIIIIGLAVCLILFATIAVPVKNGFFCDDDTIRYPYRDDTISRTACGVLAVGVSVLIVSCVQDA